MNKDNMEELKKEYDNIEVPPEVDLAIEKGIQKGKAHNKKRGTKPFGIIAAGLVLAIGMASAGKLLSTSDKALIAVDSSKSLPTVGTSENLEKLLKIFISESNGIAYGNATVGSAPLPPSSPQSSDASKSTSNGGRDSIAESSTDNYSTTNLQVVGVDEEDLVKTDGEYIFKVNAQKIINVIKAEPASNMEAINNITFEDNYSINGIFLKENTLVVVGNSYENVNPQKSDTNKAADMMVMPSNQVTKVISFDISDKKNIVKVREVEVDGFYASSRMIDSRVYVIANKYLNNIGTLKDNAEAGKAYYSDSMVGKDKIAIDYNAISYLPDSIQPNYIMVAAFNIDNNKEKVNVSTILGSGNNIYSSDMNLYIAGTKWTADGNNNGATNTIVYKFAYENTGVKFVSKGEVTGTIINQFSMDEKENYFRIATTEFKYATIMPMIDGKATPESNAATTSVAPTVGATAPASTPTNMEPSASTDTPKAPSSEQINKAGTSGSSGSSSSGVMAPPDKPISSPPQNQITNNLYVLDKDMKPVGKLQGLANGEQIYSVRFIGDRAYIVTFMLTDPLFVIDLKNPTSPKVLGELKIPGFSNYLHPYDDTHLIGFGMDTTVINEGGMDRAKLQGMKIAIFDVSNVSKPVQQFMTTIGGMGTYSEVLNNHKALLFSKEKNLLAFPVTENDYDNNTGISKQSYQGAYIYNIDLVNGIKLKGKITHIDEEKDSIKNDSMMPYYMYNGQYIVDRILYIEDTLYTISNGLIKANHINTLQEITKLKLKTVGYPEMYPMDGVREIAPIETLPIIK
jgi:inhibitor of cysteine peptidase